MQKANYKLHMIFDCIECQYPNSPLFHIVKGKLYIHTMFFWVEIRDPRIGLAHTIALDVRLVSIWNMASLTWEGL